MKTVLVLGLFLVASCSGLTLDARVLANPWNGIYWNGLNTHLLTSPLVSTRIVSPIVNPIVAVPTSSQYHAQDELGQFAFGHRGDNQARDEVKGIDGSVRGRYSYIDAEGKPIHVEYLADSLGFRVLGANNLPVAPAVPAPVELKSPEPVTDTPEVVAARADFLKKFHESTEVEKKPEEIKEEIKGVEVNRRKRAILTPYGALDTTLIHPSIISYSAPVVPTLVKSTIKTSEFKPIEDVKTPAATKKAEFEVKEHDIVTSLGVSPWDLWGRRVVTW